MSGVFRFSLREVYPSSRRGSSFGIDFEGWARFHRGVERPIQPPDDRVLEALLDAHAPFGPTPLCPEIGVFQAHDLYELWEAAEEVGGGILGPPFWAVPWPAGLAIARVLLDAPVWARGRRVLDVGVGGGVVAIAAAKAGASDVVGVDVDPWALRVAALAARRNGATIRLVERDLSERDPDEQPDLVLAADLEYERGRAPLIRARLEALVGAGAVLLAADAGRSFFKQSGLRHVASFEIPVSTAVEGKSIRETHVFCAES
jgi:predicted nicotinamide N-methyase